MYTSPHCYTSPSACPIDLAVYVAGHGLAGSKVEMASRYTSMSIAYGFEGAAREA